MSLDIFTLSENQNDKVKIRDTIRLNLTNGLPLIIKLYYSFVFVF